MSCKDWEDFIKYVKPIKVNKNIVLESNNKELFNNASANQRKQNQKQICEDIFDYQTIDNYNNPTNIDHKKYKKIKKLNFQYSNTLDLHDCRLHEAEQMIVSFLEKSIQNKADIVLIITGKGKYKEGMFQGKIRQRFLEMIEYDLGKYVVSFKEAAPNHGGSGAFYVVLRKF